MPVHESRNSPLAWFKLALTNWLLTTNTLLMIMTKTLAVAAFKNFAIRKVFSEKEYTICGPDLSTEAASYYMDHRYAYYEQCAVPCKVTPW